MNERVSRMHVLAGLGGKAFGASLTCDTLEPLTPSKLPTLTSQLPPPPHNLTLTLGSRSSETLEQPPPIQPPGRVYRPFKYVAL